MAAHSVAVWDIPVRYVSLHTHTTFSYGDGFGPVETHVERVADLGMKAVGFTEHGNTSSHVQAEKAGKKFNVKPIFGCEIYQAPTDPTSKVGEPLRTRRKFHQTVLAGSERGLQNLNRIVTASWRDHFFQWPTVSGRLLKEHNDDLFILSGCADSHLSCTLLGGKELGDRRDSYTKKDFENARRVIEWYQSFLGERYFLEVQRFPGLARTCLLNPAFAELASITGAKLVASSDVHYPFPEQNDMQRILHAAHRGGTVESADADWEYGIILSYPESDREIYEDLVGTGLTESQAKESILNTERIANQCNVILPKNERLRYPIEESDWEDW